MVTSSAFHFEVDRSVGDFHFLSCFLLPSPDIQLRPPENNDDSHQHGYGAQHQDWKPRASARRQLDPNCDEKDSHAAPE
jgi:hypothetical protein